MRIIGAPRRQLPRAGRLGAGLPHPGDGGRGGHQHRLQTNNQEIKQ